MQNPNLSLVDRIPGVRRAARSDDELVRLDRHLHGLRRHLLAIGLRGEASAVQTEIELVATLRRLS
jgi:hypothetical protein